MKGFGVLLRKEIKEQFRTNKVIIVAAVFLIFGLLSPVMTKYLPEIINSMSGTDGIIFEMSDPVSNDAILSYASNIAQFGVLMAVLLAMGAITKEIGSGTAALLLSKPVSRLSFIVAKLTAEWLNMLLGLLLSGLACCIYTLLLFNDVSVMGFVYQMLLMAVYFAFCLVITIFFSSLMKSQIAAGGLAMAVIIIVSLLSILPRVGHFLPGELINWGNQLVLGTAGNVAWGALAVVAGLIVLGVYGAWLSLRRKEL
ncbi:MAG: ABC transporter permease [Dehalococcoidia bacterium]|nr:ABC transporter permease [Dehalococcoidia bacterium]